MIGKIARSLLRIRYIVLGGVAGGAATMANKFEEFKRNLPDFSWMFPDKETRDDWRFKFRLQAARCRNWLESVANSEAGSSFASGILTRCTSFILEIAEKIWTTLWNFISFLALLTFLDSNAI